MRQKKPTPPSEIDPSENDAGDEEDIDLDELDADAAAQLADEDWEALLPEDDYEPQPEPGDFWTN